MRKQHSNMSKMIDNRESAVNTVKQGVRLVEVCKNCAMFVND